MVWPSTALTAFATVALERAGLHNLVSRLDTRARWDKLLDSDEQRAIGFARLLLVRPKWIVFDEVLEGMEPEWQSTMMEVLASMPEAAMIYIGRSDTYVETFKPRVLHLEALHAKPEAKVMTKSANAPAPVV